MQKIKQIFTRLTILSVVFQLFATLMIIKPVAVKAEEPPIVTTYTIDNNHISPNSDSIQDAATIDLEFSKAVQVDLDILGAGDIVIRDLYSSASVTNPLPKIWDGKDGEDPAQVVTDGTYNVRVTISDTNTKEVIEEDTSKTITVDTVAPTATVSYSQPAPTPTNQDVIAIIAPSEAIDLTDLSHTFTDNGTFTFNFTDLAGNPGSILAEVSNIDKVAPAASIDPLSTITDVALVFSENLFSEDTGDPLSDQFNSINLNAGDYFEAIGVNILSFGYNPSERKMSFQLSEPGLDASIVFKDESGKGVTDEAGNRYVPQIGRFAAGNWILTNGTDNTPPTAIIQYSSIDPTNQDVTATLIPSEPLLPGCTTSYTFSQNGSHDFMLIDLSGNISMITAIVANIDKEVPTAPVIFSLTSSADGTQAKLQYTFSADSQKTLIEVSSQSDFTRIISSIIQQSPLGEYSITNLTPGVQYYFRITAYDSANNSSTVSKTLTTLKPVEEAIESTTETNTAVNSTSISDVFIPVAKAAEPEVTQRPEENKQEVKNNAEKSDGQIKGGSDEKEPTKPNRARDILVIVALLAIAAAAYYGYKKLPETEEISEVEIKEEKIKKDSKSKKK